MRGKCELYEIESDLKESHLIPKFAFDYMKKTGGKYLRTYDNPNKRKQDGPKYYLLGDKAEQEFGKRERWFANNIFFPYLRDNKTLFEYDESLSYFSISILWRILTDQLKHPSIYQNKKLEFLKDVKKEWRNFLAEYTFPQNYNDLNILLTDRIKSHTTNGINVDLYMSRTVDATIVVNSDYSKVAIYVKFLRFIIWSVVKGNPNDCEDLKIDFIKGRLSVPQIMKDDFFGGFLHHRINEIDNKPKPNKEQQDKITSEILKNEKGFWNSDAGKSMINDINNLNKASR